MRIETVALTDGEKVRMDFDCLTRKPQEFIRVSSVLVIGIFKEERFPVIFV